MGKIFWRSSICDGLFKVGEGCGIVSMHDPAFAITGRHVLIDPAIPLHQLCKSQIPQFAVSFWGAYIGSGDDFAHWSSASRALPQRGILNRLPHFEHTSPGTRFPNMFIFIDRHSIIATPYSRTGVLPATNRYETCSSLRQMQSRSPH